MNASRQRVVPRTGGGAVATSDILDYVIGFGRLVADLLRDATSGRNVGGLRAGRVCHMGYLRLSHRVTLRGSRCCPYVGPEGDDVRPYAILPAFLLNA